MGVERNMNCILKVDLVAREGNDNCLTITSLSLDLWVLTIENVKLIPTEILNQLGVSILRTLFGFLHSREPKSINESIGKRSKRKISIHQEEEEAIEHKTQAMNNLRG
jgi:hypothetical protein